MGQAPLCAVTGRGSTVKASFQVQALSWHCCYREHPQSNIPQPNKGLVVQFAYGKVYDSCDLKSLGGVRRRPI